MELSGATVAVTRPRNQAVAMTSALSAAGAIVLEVPLIRIVPVADNRALRGAAAHAHACDWLVFTSANAVDALIAEMPASASGVNTVRAMPGRSGTPRIVIFATSVSWATARTRLRISMVASR